MKEKKAEGRRQQRQDLLSLCLLPTAFSLYFRLHPSSFILAFLAPAPFHQLGATGTHLCRIVSDDCMYALFNRGFDPVCIVHSPDDGLQSTPRCMFDCVTCYKAVMRRYLFCATEACYLNHPASGDNEAL